MKLTDFAVWPPPDSPVSAVTLAREMAAMAQANIAPPPFPEGAATGSGQTVIIYPGFFAPEISTGRMREFLIRQNFAPRFWAAGLNIGPTPNMFRDLERQLLDAVEETGKPVALVGISLGGTTAREMAKRLPECVTRIVTLVSPIRFPVVSPLAPLVHAASLMWDGQAREMIAAVSEPPPVPLTSVVSPVDGIVDWRLCLPDSKDADIVEVHGAHMTIGSNPDSQRVIADRLSR